MKLTTNQKRVLEAVNDHGTLAIEVGRYKTPASTVISLQARGLIKILRRDGYDSSIYVCTLANK